MMACNSLIILTCYFVAFVTSHVLESEVFVNRLDGELWDKIDSICYESKDFINKEVDQSDAHSLAIVQYTSFGIYKHPLFPSAADSLMASTHFDPSRKTVIFIHGFTDDPIKFSGLSFAIAYKVHGHANVLALDSSKLIHMFYLRSSALVKYIGEALGYVVYDLVNKGVPLENIHLVGHSLGAHIGGFAGKSYQMLKPGEKIPRITGMDPAGPCFFRAESHERLDKSDADFVDVIHTNAGVYGINKTIGHVDFYPNGGGEMQPGCIGSSCSHSRVWKFYEESVVRPHAFVASQCDSWKSFNANKCNKNEKAFMGMATPNNTRGVFYLRTKMFSPYGLGEHGAHPGMF